MGTYSQNEQWGCIATNSPPIFGSDPSTQFTLHNTAAGEITYDGNGNAHSEGRNGLNTSDGFADIGTYSCDYTYVVNDDLTFSYSGLCDVLSIFAPPGTPPAILTNQKWYGKLSADTNTLLTERHDAEPEGTSSDGIVNDINERVCGKTQQQVKISSGDPGQPTDPGSPADPGPPANPGRP